MHRATWLVGIVLALPSPLSAQDRSDAAPVIAITGVSLVDVEAGSILADRTVVLEGGRIRSVQSGGAGPDGSTMLDGRGKFLIPGLWDMHVHIRSPRAPALFLPQFIAHGVTGVRDMASDCDGPERPDQVCYRELRQWARQIDSGAMTGPRILALSSFPLNPPWDYRLTEEQARSTVRRFKAKGLDLIKLYFRLSPEGFAWIMDEARRVGIRTGGHIPLRVTAIEAADAGLWSLEHARDFLFDCFPGSTEFRRTARTQNPPPAVLRAMVEQHDPTRCDEVFRAFVRNGTWYVPTHVTRRMDALADDSAFRRDPRRRYIPDAILKAWDADADRMVALDSTPEGRRVVRGFYQLGLAVTGRAHAAGVRIVLGTDAGDSFVFPGSAVHDELGELVKAGLSPAAALAAATIEAARFLGREAEFGSVAPGKHADLVLLDGNPLDDIGHVRSIRAVVLAGRVLERAALDEMLAATEAEARKP